MNTTTLRLVQSELGPSELAQSELEPSAALLKGFEAISAGDGLSISITGMLIVFVALSLISLFIRLLPVLLQRLGPVLPKLESHTQPPKAAEQLPSDKQKIVAAIGYVLHMEMERESQSSN